MSNKSWQVALCEALNRLRKPDGPPRVAVVGIGHELRGDDAAGLLLTRALRTRITGEEGLLAIEGGSAPENFCGVLRRFAPDLVLLVDAADMDAEPGTVRWLPWQETTGISASTHTLPMHILATYLTADLNCEVALLGIQPADTSIGAPLTSAVQEAAEATARALAETRSLI